MGIGVVVHGIIKAPGWGSQPASLRVYRLNKSVISALPAIDPHWPFITKSMFAFAPYRTDIDLPLPQYELQVIHFAATYKDMFILQADWIHKFERILAQLWWTDAVVYSDFSLIKYAWTSEWSEESFTHDPPTPPSKWKLACYKQEATPIPLKEAIDGTYTPLTNTAELTLAPSRLCVK
jgi:hypothetical protein